MSSLQRVCQVFLVFSFSSHRVLQLVLPSPLALVDRTPPHRAKSRRPAHLLHRHQRAPETACRHAEIERFGLPVSVQRG
ncbi:hypothetical protein BC567DRAFT_239749 [Phyllosticta citribraziliensis]